MIVSIICEWKRDPSLHIQIFAQTFIQSNTPKESFSAHKKLFFLLTSTSFMRMLMKRNEGKKSAKEFVILSYFLTLSSSNPFEHFPFLHIIEELLDLIPTN